MSSQLSATERVERSLAALADTGPAVNSVVRLDVDGARRAARDIDAARDAGRPVGPLAGIPISIKDSFDVRGMVSSHGIVAQSHVADDDAPAVAALRAAGCVIVGKTNVPRLLNDYQACSEEFGHTRNPLDSSRTGGGSSGGAAAVAAGQVAFDLGSDMAGSVRVPAMFCGVSAWRPTHGLISKARHLPWPTDIVVSPPSSTVGVIAPRVADLRLPAEVLLATNEILRGHVPRPAVRRPWKRIGIWMPEWPRTGRSVLTAIDLWLDVLRRSGIEVVPVVPRHGSHDALATYHGLMAAERAHGGVDGEADARPLLALLEAQARARFEWSRLLDDVDVVVAPVAPVVAPPVSDVPIDDREIDIDGQRYPATEMLTWCTVTSLCQAPSVTVAVGAEDTTGLPIGVQIIGRRGADRELLAGAAEWELHGLVGDDRTR
ncbi:amidase family protein [Gordonia sp. DT219]|uniref:amidase family protein n=1 Tax=Gordonia sp. DT219 TaxID=3416658 RepID=UPI003CF840A8